MGDLKPVWAKEPIGTVCCQVHGDMPIYRVGGGCPACAAEACKADARGQVITPQQRQAQAIESAGIKSGFADAKLLEFTAEQQGKAKRWMRRLVAEPNTHHTLLILGPPGTGKTRLLCAMAIELLGAGNSVLVITHENLTRAVRQTWDEPGVSEESVLRKYEAVDVLILDDLGSGRSTENSALQLAGVIDNRYSANRPIIVSSNYAAPDLPAIVGDRAWDRLKHGAEILAMDGASRRLPAKP